MSKDLNDMVSTGYHKLPKRIKPYIALSRVDRPVGTWLCLLPVVAAILFLSSRGISIPLLIVISLGAFICRSAGSTINDIFDRNFDGQVERTRFRPLANGDITLKNAILFFLFQMLLAFFLMLMLKVSSIILILLFTPLIIIYPLLKRYTYWPQLALGMVFNFGILVVSTEVYNSVTAASLLLWIGCIFWQLGYDTVYAYSDLRDDRKLGLKSTAMFFDAKGKLWVSSFYVITLLMWVAAGIVDHKNAGYFIFMFIIALQLIRQLVKFDINNVENCNALFKGNIFVGLSLTLAALVSVTDYNLLCTL